MDIAAAKLGIDPAEIRLLNHLKEKSLPLKSASGLEFENVSLDECLNTLISKMNYADLRKEQKEKRKKGIYRGIGLATFVEQTAVGASLYGPAGIKVSAQEGCSLRLDPSGMVHCSTSITDQGQGTLFGIQQIIAVTLGVELDSITVESGDGRSTPYGGGSWASRGIAIGGEAARLASLDLRKKIFEAVAIITQEKPKNIRLVDGKIFRDSTFIMDLTDLSKTLHFRQDTLPSDVDFEMNITRHFVPRSFPYFMANGTQGSYLEVDIGTGEIKLLDHWIVEDCGKVINPLLVDEQLRGGIVQGIGAALFEECIYDNTGQLLTASFADYAVPLASAMPDIHVYHVENAALGTGIGSKGAGEAGALGAPAAIWCALNDAVRSIGIQMGKQPFTPSQIIQTLHSQNRLSE
jgi:carbon-monoxide dehydrogenase large subunit